MAKKLKIYVYDRCGTCRKACQFLDDHDVPYDKHPIRDTPPTKSELKTMLARYDGDIRRLFNTSGLDYKAMNLKDKLPDLSESEAIDLLTTNGNLVRRPFVIGADFLAAGFKEHEWTALTT